MTGERSEWKSGLIPQNTEFKFVIFGHQEIMAERQKKLSQTFLRGITIYEVTFYVFVASYVTSE